MTTWAGINSLMQFETIGLDREHKLSYRHARCPTAHHISTSEWNRRWMNMFTGIAILQHAHNWYFLETPAKPSTCNSFQSRMKDLLPKPT
jgi:hypothetical protein